VNEEKKNERERKKKVKSARGLVAAEDGDELREDGSDGRGHGKSGDDDQGKDQKDDGEIGEALDDIVRDNSRAVATIRQLRSLFQRGEMQTQPVDIQNIFRDIDRIVGADARERKIDLRVDVAPPLPRR